jgi:hypothetical protein
MIFLQRLLPKFCAVYWEGRRGRLLRGALMHYPQVYAHKTGISFQCWRGFWTGLRKLFANPLAIKKALACEGLFVNFFAVRGQLVALAGLRILSKKPFTACAEGRFCGVFFRRGAII